MISADGESLTVYHLDEGIDRQATGWTQPFARALKNGQLRPATAFDLEQFADVRRRALADKQPGRALLERTKPPVTHAVREHIADLRRLLQGRAVNR